MIFIRKKFKNLRKFLKEIFFYIYYGKIVFLNKKINGYKYLTVKLEGSKKYKIHLMKKSRVYFNKITDVAYIKNNNLICQPSIQQRNFINKDCFENTVLREGTPSFMKKVNGTTCSFIYSESAKDNYWHWMFDILPKIAILQKMVDFKKIDYFLFPGISKKFQNETLNIFKIPQKKRLSSTVYNHVYSKNLIACDHPFISKNLVKDQKKFPKWIGTWYKKIIPLNKIKRERHLKKIYIDRSDSKNPYRSILNENELKKFLKSKSYKIVKLSNLSFLDQVKLFYNAKIIVGLHGAGFANIVFCRPKTKVIELGTTKRSQNIIYYLANKNKLNYKCILFKSDKNNLKKSSRHQDSHIKVNIQKIINAV